MDGFFLPSLDFPDSDMGPLATAIGSLVLMWGTTEAGINVCVATIFKASEGKHHAKEIPRNLSGKLKILRRCLRKIEALGPYREEGLRIFATAGQFGDHRNAIVHGFLSDYNPETKKFTFTGLGSKGASPLITGQPEYSISDIVEIGQACSVHGAEVASFTKRLVDTFVG